MTEPRFEIEIAGQVVAMTAAECRDLAGRLLALVDRGDDGWRRGCVVSYSAIKGFGFVAPDLGGGDVWFRKEFTALADSELRPGCRVEYLVAEIAGKLRVSAMRLAV